MFCFYSGVWVVVEFALWPASLTHVRDAGEALLCALACEAELGSDDCPGCSGLAGSGDGGGQGGFGGACLLVGGGDPAQDVERRTGW